MHPPISIVARTLQFIMKEIPRAKVVCVIPKWDAQAWFTSVPYIFDYIYIIPARAVFVPTKIVEQ